MTAMTVIVGPESVTLLTDRGRWDNASGRLLGLQTKYFLSHDLRMCAILQAKDGPPVWREMQDLLARASSQQEALQGLASALRSADSALLAQGKPPTGACVCVGLVDAQGPRAAIIKSKGADFIDGPPYFASPLFYVCSPPPAEGKEPHGGTALTARTAADLAQAQRAAAGRRYVAGAADLITIDKVGLRVETVCRWRSDYVAMHLQWTVWGVLWRRIQPLMPKWKRLLARTYGPESQ